jgi:hypothetical protein
MGVDVLKYLAVRVDSYFCFGVKNASRGLVLVDRSLL